MPSWDNEPNGFMTAAVITSPGAKPASKCFTITHEYPKPTPPGPDWVLVRVKAVGLNRAELRGRNGDKPGLGEFGIFQSEYHEDPPKVLGEEFVGIIEGAGTNTTFKPGDSVAGWIYGGGKAHDGAYAQYTICHSSRCFHIPSTTLSWKALGGIFMSMWTAWGSLFEAAQIKTGSIVLIHGGTSSVGVWAILLARDHGCTVFATTRKVEKVEKLKDAGAHYVLLEEGLNEKLKAIAPDGVDCILELMGANELHSFAFRNLKRHRTIVATGILTGWSIDDFKPSSIPTTRKLSFYTGPIDEGREMVERVMRDVVTKVEEGVFKEKVYLDKVFRLEDVGMAHEYMEENRAVGKVVLMIP